MKSILETFWCSWLLYKHMSFHFNGRSRDRPDPAVGGGGNLRVVLIVFTTFFFPFLISERKKLEEQHQQNHQLKQQ